MLKLLLEIKQEMNEIAANAQEATAHPKADSPSL